MRKYLQRKLALLALSLYIKGLNLRVSAISRKAMKQSRKKGSLTNIYTSIAGFPLNKFLDYYIDKDYNALIKNIGEGKTDITNQSALWKFICRKLFLKYTYVKPDILDLIKCGNDVYLQYIDASGGDEASRHIKLLGSIYKTESKIERVKQICESLLINYSDSLVADLKELGIRTNIRQEFLEQDVALARIDAKRYEIELARYYQLLEKDNKKESHQPTREMFYDVLIAHDANLTPEKIDVMTYCRIYKKLQERAKMMDKNAR